MEGGRPGQPLHLPPSTTDSSIFRLSARDNEQVVATRDASLPGSEMNAERAGSVRVRDGLDTATTRCVCCRGDAFREAKGCLILHSMQSACSSSLP